MIRRREFFAGTSLAAVASSVAACTRAAADNNAQSPEQAGQSLEGAQQIQQGTQSLDAEDDFESWEGIRKQFRLDPALIHMSMFFLASHPRMVSAAIEEHRAALERNPIHAVEASMGRTEFKIRSTAAQYLGVDPAEVALTDSTTMGLGLMYSGLALSPGDEVLAASHQHYATEETLRVAAEHHSATVRRFELFANSSTASVGEMVENLRRAIHPQTKALALTWVDSLTGLRIPSRELANVIAEENSQRSPENQIIYCLDGVHGFGIEGSTVDELGCDFFAAGCHKWMFGPRGTGILYGRRKHWPRVRSTIAAFEQQPYEMWTGKRDRGPIDFGQRMSPGGFHSFEMRWALPAAFEWHAKLGKDKVRSRIHELNRQLKLGINELPHIVLNTPLNDELSSGIVSFDVKGMQPEAVVEALAKKRIVASTTPSANKHVRLAPSLVNTPDEVAASIKALAELV